MILAGSGIYLLTIGKTSPPTPIPSLVLITKESPTLYASFDPTAEWKTYTLKYPPQDLILESCANYSGIEGEEYIYIELKKWFGASWNPSVQGKCRIVSVNPGWILFVQQGIYKNTFGDDYKTIQTNELTIETNTFTRYLYMKKFLKTALMRVGKKYHIQF